MRGLRECCDLLRLLRATASAATHITVAASAASTTSTTAFAGTFVEFLAASTTTAARVFTLALRASAAHFRLAAAAGHYAHAAALLLGIRRAGTIARSERDLELIEFVPLGIGAIAIGNSQQFLHALAR